jgi:excisionase family DNA binding protein
MSDTDRTTYTVAEAADRLDVSTDAIRKRLSRGTLEGVKVDGAWRVVLDNQPDTRQDTSDATVDAAVRHRPDSGAPPELVDELRETIVDLRTRMDWFQSEVTRLGTEATEARRRADMLAALNQGAQNRIRELEALHADVVQTNENVESPVSDAAAPTDTSTHVETNAAPPSLWARLWRAINGQN